MAKYFQIQTLSIISLDIGYFVRLATRQEDIAKGSTQVVGTEFRLAAAGSIMPQARGCHRFSGSLRARCP